MTDDEFARGVDVVRSIYPQTEILESVGASRALKIAPITIPTQFWGGGQTRLLVKFDLSQHETTRPLGFLGDEWKLPGGGVPYNANPTYLHGEAWQGYSWNFPWPPTLSVLETVEAFLGRFDDPR